MFELVSFLGSQQFEEAEEEEEEEGGRGLIVMSGGVCKELENETNKTLAVDIWNGECFMNQHMSES